LDVLKTIYEGAVVPLLTYGASIWIEAIRKNKNLTKYKRIQRLMNIKTAKAYRAISYDASCAIAAVRSIQITIEQKVQTYMVTKIENPEYDAPLEVRYWRHPAELPTIREVENGSTYTTEVYTYERGATRRRTKEPTSPEEPGPAERTARDANGGGIETI
jgi:hypothetical protein